MQGKQVKSQTLHEMLEYITSQRGTITEQIYPEVVQMVSLDIARYDWCLHLVCYEFVQIYTTSSESIRGRI